MPYIAPIKFKKHAFDRQAEKVAWAKYRKRPSLKNMNDLVVMYMYLVQQISGAIANKVPASVDTDAMTQEGMSVLHACIKRYDKSKNTSFQVFASPRIRGAMIDYLRVVDPVPRLTRSREEKINKTVDSFFKRNGFSPSYVEMQQGLNLNDRDMIMLVRDGKAKKYASIDREVETNKNDFVASIRDNLVDKCESSAIDSSDARDLSRRLMKSLCGVERLVMYYMYVHDASQILIGHIAKLTDSRVSQLHKKILVRIKENIEKGVDACETKSRESHRKTYHCCKVKDSQVVNQELV